MISTTLNARRAEWRETVDDCLARTDAQLPCPNWYFILIADIPEISDFKPLPLKNISTVTGVFREMPPDEQGRIIILPVSYKILIDEFDEDGNKTGSKLVDRATSYFVSAPDRLEPETNFEFKSSRFQWSKQEYRMPKPLEFRCSALQFAYMIRLED